MTPIIMHHNPELELAWDFVEKTNKNIFLTGKAGTGKTTFLHKIRNESFKRLVVVAPTGVAAINAKGVTIHSFFQMSFGPILPPEADGVSSPQNRHNNTKFQKKFNKKKIDIIRSLDLLIIDEVSMVRADLLDGIDQVLRRYRDKNKVFGGVQLLMIGDLQQLAPVVKNDEWSILRPYYDTAFFFSSKAFQESAAVGIELKHIYRQDNAIFIGILNEIRNNNLSQESLEILNKRYQPDFKPSEDSGYITLTTHNNRANKMNLEELEGIKRKSHFFKASIDGDFPEHAYPTLEKLEFKVGAQVMFIKNDSAPEKRFYNGKIGKIVQMSKHEIVVRCPGDNHDITTEKEAWDNLSYSINEQTKEISEKVKGSFNQIPLRLAWSITIHKSQGLTFERAIIDAESSFAHGQTYVALSRCTTLEGIVLKSRIGRNGIIQDTRVIGFTQEVEEKSPDKKQLQQAQNNYQLQLIDDIFRFPNLGYLVNRCLKVEFQNSNILKGNIT
ncbi:MAG: AAA family ATPase, partial [Bacteroidales bacterium]|nr:AAA family ATPase [Bacteroidales bacterium]